MFIDSHTHLFDTAFDQDRAETMSRALDAGVLRMYLPNIDVQTVDAMLLMADTWPEHCFPMLGLHPCSVKEDYREVLAALYERFEAHRFAAIGEIGLDYHWDTAFKEEQKVAFQQQIDWAKKRGLPIAIHTRDSFEDALAMVEANQDGSLSGVFHCFTGSAEEARRVVDTGFYIGIGGIATFKNGGLAPVLQQMSLSHILLETDAPYLAPAPHRGKRNESAYIPLIAQKVAEVKEVSVAQVAEITTKNALNLFDKNK